MLGSQIKIDQFCNGHSGQVIRMVAGQIKDF
jgi:hypothetical protein